MSKIVGLVVDKPRQGAPAFVKARVGINVAPFGQWLRDNADDRGWVNLDLLLSMAGDLYLKHNEFKPRREDTDAFDRAMAEEGSRTPKPYPRAKADAPDDMNSDEVPF
jgi:hypothetical protein